MSKIDAESYYDYDQFDSESTDDNELEETENESRIKSFKGFILMTESQRNPVGPGEPGAIHIELNEDEASDFIWGIRGLDSVEQDLPLFFKEGRIDFTEDGSWVWFYADDKEVKAMLNEYYPELMKDLL